MERKVSMENRTSTAINFCVVINFTLCWNFAIENLLAKAVAATYTLNENKYWMLSCQICLKLPIVAGKWSRNILMNKSWLEFHDFGIKMFCRGGIYLETKFVLRKYGILICSPRNAYKQPKPGSVSTNNADQKACIRNLCRPLKNMGFPCTRCHVARN